MKINGKRIGRLAFLFTLATIIVFNATPLYGKYVSSTTDIGWNVNINASGERFLGALGSEAMQEGGKVIYGVETLDNGKTFEENIKDESLREAFKLGNFEGYSISVFNDTQDYLKVSFDLQMCIGWPAVRSPANFDPPYTVSGKRGEREENYTGNIHGQYEQQIPTDVSLRLINSEEIYSDSSVGLGGYYQANYNEDGYIESASWQPGLWTATPHYRYSALLSPEIAGEITGIDCAWIIPPGEMAEYYNISVDYGAGVMSCYASIHILLEPWVQNT